MSLSEWAGGQVFKLVHGHNLVYNTCWEDPRLDRQALKLAADDTVLVITSAGCNALDYALAGPKQVVAVDMNPRQNALLDLKLAGIRHLDYEDFFAMFGEGRLWASNGSMPTNCGLPSPSGRGATGTAGSSSSTRRIAVLSISAAPAARLRCHQRLHQPRRQAPAADQRLAPVRHRRPAAGDLRTAPPRAVLVQVDATSPCAATPSSPAGRAPGPAAPDRNPVSGRDQQLPAGLRRGGLCPAALERQLLLAGLHDGPLHAGVLPGVPQARQLPEAPRRAGRSRPDAHRFGGRVLDEGPAADIAFRALGPHGLAFDAAAAAIGPGMAVDRPPRGGGARILWRRAGCGPTLSIARIVADGQSRSVGEMLTYDRALAEELHCRCRVHTYGSFHIADLAA